MKYSKTVGSYRSSLADQSSPSRGIGPVRSDLVSWQPQSQGPQCTGADSRTHYPHEPRRVFINVQLAFRIYVVCKSKYRSVLGGMIWYSQTNLHPLPLSRAGIARSMIPLSSCFILYSRVLFIRRELGDRPTCWDSWDICSECCFNCFSQFWRAWPSLLVSGSSGTLVST